MFGLKERPCYAHVLISIRCDSDIKNYDFRILRDFSVLFILVIIKIC